MRQWFGTNHESIPPREGALQHHPKIKCIKYAETAHQAQQKERPPEVGRGPFPTSQTNDHSAFQTSAGSDPKLLVQRLLSHLALDFPVSLARRVPLSVLQTALISPCATHMCSIESQTNVASSAVEYFGSFRHIKND